MTRTATSLIVAVGSLVAALAAQQTPVFKSGVDLVQLDVSVLDKERQPVRGLTQADFTILEDGKPQAVQAFSAIDLPDVVTTGAAWTREVAPDVATNEIPPDGRVFVIVLDDSAMPTDLAAVETTRKSALSIIDHMGPRDLAAVVFTARNQGAQNLTGNRARLRRAVETLSRMGNIPMPAPQSAQPGRPRGLGLGPMPDAKAPTCNFYLSSIQVVQRAAEYLFALPQRRKALVYVSGGMFVNIPTAMIVGPLLPPDTPGNNPCGSAVVASLREVFRAAQAANVAVYGIDPLGLHDAPLGSATESAMNFLQAVSDNTGGHAILKTNDYEPGITQIFRENSSYYLVGYRPANVKADGTIRRIEVKVARPGVEVRTKTNYVAPKPDDGKAPPQPSKAVQAMSEIVPNADVTLHLAAAPFAVPGSSTPRVALTVGLEQPLQPGRIADEVDLLVKTFTPEGKEVASAEQTIPIIVPPARRGSDASRYEVLSLVEMKPGRYELRMSVHSSAFDKHGSVYADVDVPDFAKSPLSLSGVLLSTTPGLPVAPAEAFKAIAPMVPTASREFSRVDRVKVFLRVYQGGKDRLAPVTLTARIVDAKGAPVFEKSETIGADRFGTTRASDYEIALPLAPLGSGEYLLSVEAGLDKTTARRDVRFTVK